MYTVSEPEVLIVGAGPVGLMLACELRLGGVTTVVLEREVSPDPALSRGAMGARSINVPTARALARHDLLEEVKAAALWWFDPRSTELPPFLGHFAGIPLRRENFLAAAAKNVDTEDLGGGAIAIGDLVDILAKRAESLGATIQRGVEVTRLDSLDAAFVIGCDGGRSAIRRLANIDFPGTDGESVGRVALVDFAPGHALEPSDWIDTPRGRYLHSPPGRIHVVEPIGDESRGGPVTREELEACLARVVGRPITLANVHVATRYTDAARLASTYRRGRVFLAGDAAHIHSPAGGQGMNQGIGDAICLAEKLISVLRHGADEALLDRYDEERRPVAERVLRWSRAQSALSRRDASTDALREVMAELLDNPRATSYVLATLAGLPPQS